MLSTRPEYNTIIIVPTSALQDQWLEHVKEFRLINTQVYVINTIALKDINYKANLLILDETQRYTSDRFRTIFQKVSYSWILSLSATLEQSHLDILNKYCPVVDTVDMVEAKTNNYVSNFTIYNLGIELPYSDCKKLDNWQNEYYEYIHAFGGDINNVYRALKDQTYLKQLSLDLGWTIGEIMGMAKGVNRIVAERKKFFYEHPYKLQLGQEIFEKFSNKKILTYSESIAFMEKLNTPDSLSFHSKMSKKAKISAMNQFKEKIDSLRILNGGKSICEGIDVPNLEMGVRFSFTSSKVKALQFLGRIARKEGNKNAILINIYMDRQGKKTQEKQWLEKSFENTNLPVEWIKDLKEIKL